MIKSIFYSFCLIALLFGAQTAKADDVTITTKEDSVYITTTSYGQLKTAFEASESTIATTITAKQYKGYFLMGEFTAAELRLLFGQKFTDSDSIVAAYVEKLDMLGAMVDSIKGTSKRSNTSMSFPDCHGNTMLPGWDKTFTQLTWWGIPKVKSTTGSYTFPSNTWLNEGNSHNSFRYSMPKLQHITINEGCTAIGGSAFRACNNLSEVKVLSTMLKTLGQYSFSYCYNLNDIHDLLYAGVEEIQMEAFAGSNVKNTEANLFPNTLKTIGNAAFRRNQYLGPVIRIPASVTKIEGSAFQDCCITDVYFLGTTFPQCANAAFWGYDYLMDKSSNKTLNENYATRDSYDGYTVYNLNQGFQKPPMFHYRPDVAETELAKVTDNMRSYTVPDKFFGKSRMWPTPTEFNTMWTNCKEKKNYEGTVFADEQMKYVGIIQFPFRRADAPMPDAVVPIKDNTWYTLCLPVNWQPDKTVYGNYQLLTLKTVTRNADTHTVKLTFNAVDDADKTVKAWTPYLFKAGDSFTYNETAAPKILDHVLQLGSEKPVEVTATQVGSDKQETATWTYYWLGNCEGLYHKSGETSTNYSIDRPRYAYYLGEKDSKTSFFYQTTSKQRVWAPYSASVMAYCSDQSYQTEDTPGITVDDSFRNSDGSLASKKSVLTSFDGDGETTIIIELPDTAAVSHASGDIYDLTGRQVGTAATNLSNLPAGIYIVGGKKVVVK